VVLVLGWQMITQLLRINPMTFFHSYLGRHTWNISRVAFLLIGLIFLINAFYDTDWTLGILGAWFTLMGFLRVGCAGSSCNYNPPE